MIWIDLLRTLLILLIPTLCAAQALTLEGLYTLVFLTAIVSTVFGPALASAVPLIVERSRFTAANAFIQSTTNIGVLMGPALSGLGIALIGAQNVLYVDSATFLISALCLLPIRMREPLASPRWLNSSGSVMHDLLIGFRFVFLQHRMVFMLMVTAALFHLGASAFMFLLPVFAEQSLGVGPVELGWLSSILGTGMLAASTCLVWIKQGNLHRRLRIISGSMAVGGLAISWSFYIDNVPKWARLLGIADGREATYAWPPRSIDGEVLDLRAVFFLVVFLAALRVPFLAALRVPFLAALRVPFFAAFLPAFLAVRFFPAFLPVFFFAAFFFAAFFAMSLPPPGERPRSRVAQASLRTVHT